MSNFAGKIKRCLLMVFLMLLISAVTDLNGAFADQEKFKKITLLSIWSRAPVLDVGYFTALEKGFYKDEGLEVSLEGGAGSMPNVELVGQKKVFAASANVYNTMKARLKGVPVISIGVLHQSLASGIVSLKENPITKPADLKDKKIAILSGTVHEVLYKAFMKRQNLDRKDVVEVMTPETVTLLISKKVDGCTSAVYNAPVLVEIAGLTPTFMAYDDYGLDCYGNNLIVNEDSVKNDPDLVRAFLRATVKGWKYIFSHKKEAVDIIIKYNPTADPRYVSNSLERMLPKITSKDTEKFGLFYQTEEKWNQAQDILLDSGEIDRKSDTKIFFSNEFLPKK